LKKIETKLHLAEKHFQVEDSMWGLGLTYNLLGRVYCFKKMYNFHKSKEYYEKAVFCFKSIDHHRGIFVTLKD